MYQHWAANDSDLAFPLYAKAEELGIPIGTVMTRIHRGRARLALALKSPEGPKAPKSRQADGRNGAA